MSGLSAEQLEMRKGKVTGSTVAAYLGYNPWMSPRAMWLQETGAEPFHGNKATEIGLMLEPGLGRLAQKWGKLGPMKKGKTEFHKHKSRWWVATPDYLFPREQVGLQIKNHGFHMKKGFMGMPGERGEWDNDLVPLYLQMQCQWEMAVVQSYYETRWSWLLGCLIGGDDYRLYKIKWAPGLLRGMQSTAYGFWEKHLDPSGKMEEPDDSSWKHAKKPQGRKPRLTTEELAAAPIPDFGAIAK